MQTGLFILGVLAIPFSDFFGLLPLGEMKNELSAYIFIPLLLVILFNDIIFKTARPSTYRQKIYLLPVLALAMLLLVAMSGLLNLAFLFGPAFQGRLPIEKYFSSSLVLAYGFALAYMADHLLRQGSFQNLIVKPVCLSICVCAAFACLEILAPYGGPFARLYAISIATIHVGKQIPEGMIENMPDWATIGRARSVCYEPPALAAFAGVAWPWAYAGVATATKSQKPAYLLVLLLCTGLIIIAMSRTSAVLLFGNLVVYLLLRFVYLPPLPQARVVVQIASIFLILLTFLTVCLGTVYIGAFTDNVMRSTDYSDVTRYGLITAAINMFFSRPLWGYGFGQFGFHYVDFLPAWAYRSYEIRDYVSGKNGWPPIYSSYARFAAETGIFGVLTWVGIWALTVQRVWRATIVYQCATGRLLIASYPLIMSCICALLLGVSLDSLRTPMMWLSMGASCWYVGDVRRRLAEIRKSAR